MKNAEASINMPLSKMRYAIVEADTRPMEILLAVLSLAWGVWLPIIYKNPYPSSFWTAIDSYGGPAIWSTWIIISGLLQINSIWYRYPYLRRFSASLAAVYWIMAGYCLMRTEPKMFIIVMSGVLAIGHLWIVMRRSAMGK